MIFVEAPTSTEQMRRINDTIEGPTFAGYLEGGKIPLLSAQEFGALGYDVAPYACSSVYAAAFTPQETFRRLWRPVGPRNPAPACARSMSSTNCSA